VAGLAGTLAVAALGLAINLAGQGKITLAQLPKPVLALADGAFDRLEGECRPGDLGAAHCAFGTAAAQPSVLLWGNSFGRMWIPALGASAARHDVAGVALVLSRCPPLLGVAMPEIRGCDAFNRDALAFLDQHPALDTVVLGGNWLAWAKDLPGLAATVEALRQRGRRVVLILSPPEIPYDVPRTLALAALRGTPPPPPLAETAARAAMAPERDFVDALAARDRLTVIDPFATMCDRSTCAVERDGHALYSDAAHVSRFGAGLSASLFDPVFDVPSRPR
jgi:hypothetical protein